MTRLVNAGLVDADWNAGPDKGMVTDSVVSLVTRKGNPKNIKTLDDLVKPGVEVITPNPFSSGAARWNIMAAYGAKTADRRIRGRRHGVPRQDCSSNVSVQDDSGRAALQTFTGGKGDVLLSYENEAIFAQQNGQDVDYVVPDTDAS